MAKFSLGQKVKVTRYIDSSLVGQVGYIDGDRGTMKRGRGTTEGSTGGFLVSPGEVLYIVKLESPPPRKPQRISVTESGLEPL